MSNVEDFIDANPLDHHSYRTFGVPVIRKAYDLTFTPPSAIFPDTPVWTISDPIVFKVTNSGWMDIPILGISVSGPYQVLAVVPSSLAPGESLSVEVRQKPLDLGVLSGHLMVDTGTKAGGVYRATLSGQGAENPDVWDHTADVDAMLAGLWGFLQRSVQPAIVTSGPLLSLSNTSVDFTEVNVDSSSDIHAYTITNAGNQPLIIDDISISGDFETVP